MQIYLVGGAVRDEMLGYPSHENDYVVVGATPEQMQSKGFVPVGKDFPVFLHPETKEEYALARTERKTGRGYKGFNFNASPDITLEEDLQRRDLTINAIAKSDSGYIIDPFRGREDINNRQLRHVSEAFREDPVRILRTARFAARYHHLGFRVADETLELMRAMVNDGEANHLVAERVWKEFSRALGERSLEVFIQTLDQCGALKVVAPEIGEMLQRQRCLSGSLTTTPAILALCHATKRNAETSVRMAAMLHDIDPDEQRARELIESLSERFNMPKHYSELAILVIRFHERAENAFDLNPSELYDLLENTDALRRPERFDAFSLCCEIYRDDVLEKNHPQHLAHFLRQAREVINRVGTQPLIEQGYKGKQFGEVLRKRRIEALQLLHKN